MRSVLLAVAASLWIAACGGGGSTAEDAAASAERETANATAVAEVWTLIADEGQAFQVTGTQTVRYGQGSTWIQRSVTNSGQCTNTYFGSDPLFGVVKRCELLGSEPPPPGDVWTFIANEGQPFTLTGTQTVRYGQGSTWIQRSVTNSGQCTNTYFGSDPLFGVVKRCEVLSSTPPPPPAADRRCLDLHRQRGAAVHADRHADGALRPGLDVDSAQRHQQRPVHERFLRRGPAVRRRQALRGVEQRTAVGQSGQ